jgi:DNA-binding transcriptional ArsR family regulator
MKTTKQLERYFKGAANHWRLAILLLVQKREGLTLDEIIHALNANQKTISQHTRVLVQAGLLNKEYVGRQVAHKLSPYGQRFVSFIKTF